MRQGRFITICVAALLAMAIAPAWAIATPASFVDTTFDGTNDNTLSQTGLVILQPNVQIDEGFAGTALPTGWTSTPWAAGGDATVSGGVLNVDGTLVGPTATFNAGQSLEFTATFGDQPFRHVGFGANFNDPPWAMFSTGGGTLATGLYARTNIGGTEDNEPIAGFDPTVAHDYEIRWTATAVGFFVDGTLVSTQPVALPDGQRVLASDFNVGGGALTVDDLSLVSYPTSGIFTSRVFDASTHVTAWGALAAEGDLTGVTFQTRSGSTATPDATWSDWQPVGADGAVQSPVRQYLQYRASLTGDTTSTPFITQVSIGYDVDNTAPSVSISGVAVSGTSATVSFSSSDADVAGFECSLDGGAYVACASPKVYTGLTVGDHTISVRATDKLGNVGVAASRTFTIQRPVTPPPSGDHSGPKVVPTPRSVRASRTGRVTFRVRCPNSEQRCKITLQLKRGHKVVSSKKTVRLLGGKRAKLTLRLATKYRRYLSTHSRLKAKAVTVAQDAANNRRTTRVNVTVRAPKHKR